MNCPLCHQPTLVGSFAHATFFFCKPCEIYSDMTGAWFHKHKGRLNPQPEQVKDWTQPNADLTP